MRVGPDRVLFVPSSEPGRTVRVEVYEPRSAGEDLKPCPVHVNYHLGGFACTMVGLDAEICYYLSRQLGIVVLDADYAKAPERPFPAGFNDILSLVAYIQSGAQRSWDASRLTLGGYSAGANLALVAAAALPPGTVKAVVAWYPPCDLRPGKRPKASPVPGDELPGVGPGHILTEDLAIEVFGRAYLQGAVDPTDPRLSPVCCDTARFPPISLFIGTADPLYWDCLKFYERLVNAGRDVDILVVPRGRHVWERFAKPGTIFWDYREEAFRRMMARLRHIL
ncbi:alpha/beta-hydrolase [Exidia glandulosa HHB12029]|uniref:Alpha/beta-hydrolase n=1 Tax=Exidia glandulosa HHB12029 TaxID=1314781 RepID=A0A165CGW5_EXIGL|nr:alpha/beta-hydrolase [Exidia glandulosa HHB12029]